MEKFIELWGTLVAAELLDSYLGIAVGAMFLIAGAYLATYFVRHRRNGPKERHEQYEDWVVWSALSGFVAFIGLFVVMAMIPHVVYPEAYVIQHLFRK
jgi:hypothetical protein